MEINTTYIFPPKGDEFWSKPARDMAQILITFGGFDRKELMQWLIDHVTIKNHRVQERHVLEAADDIYNKHQDNKMDFGEALEELNELTDDCKYRCKVCGHTTNYQWAIWRHLDNKHGDKLFELSGQAHGWNDARIGWKE